ncbi:hypothetical protein T459_30771 [Capsicum annuum]|uniref:GRF-type domain-containing protein n=1 Tax=Capsicum annuum TaxID=4072 RepID=A0A2G2Y9A4_CAPAN|nr:hypothetical protein T459_30771 [Capsicum annuum]
MLRNEREYSVAAIFNLIAYRFGEIFRKRYAEVDNSKITFIPVAKIILRENMTEGDKLYVNNINRSTDEFTVLGYGHSTKFNLSRRSCSCRKYDLLKESYLLAYLELICAAPLESEWSVAPEYLEMQVLPPDFDPKLERRKVKRVKVLKASRTDRNLGQKFYSCVVGKDNGGCFYFKWISSDSKVSKFQGIAKFEMLKRLRDFEENRDLLMTLYRESKYKIDHLKGLLKDIKIERDQLQQGHENYGLWFTISFSFLEKFNGGVVGLNIF